MSRSAREQRQGPASSSSPVQTKAKAEGHAVQLKASLRGQDFAAQEAMLAPGADMGDGVTSAAPVQQRGGGESTAVGSPDKGAAPMVDGKPVQMKGLMSNLSSKGGWNVRGQMPQYPLSGGWHGSVFRTGAKGPTNDGMFFDGFHLTWEGAPKGDQPHIFFDHAGNLDEGQSRGHGQTKNYGRFQAGQRGNPALNDVIGQAAGKAGTVASTLGKNLTTKEEEELEAQANLVKSEKEKKEKEERERREGGVWEELAKNSLCTPMLLEWLKRANTPGELRWFGDPVRGKARRDEEDLKKGREPLEDAPKPSPEIVEEVVAEVSPVEEVGTSPGSGTEVVEVVEEVEEVVSETPTVVETPTKAPPESTKQTPKKQPNPPKNKKQPPPKKKGGKKPGKKGAKKK